LEEFLQHIVSLMREGVSRRGALEKVLVHDPRGVGDIAETTRLDAEEGEHGQDGKNSVGQLKGISTQLVLVQPGPI
jgi:hypothetical protein